MLATALSRSSAECRRARRAHAPILWHVLDCFVKTGDAHVRKEWAGGAFLSTADPRAYLMYRSPSIVDRAAYRVSRIVNIFLWTMGPSYPYDAVLRCAGMPHAALCLDHEKLPRTCF